MIDLSELSQDIGKEPGGLLNLIKNFLNQGYLGNCKLDGWSLITQSYLETKELEKLKAQQPVQKQQQTQQVIIQQIAPQQAEDIAKIHKVLDGLDERLALGEISEETYHQLKRKWKEKLK